LVPIMKIWPNDPRFKSTSGPKLFLKIPQFWKRVVFEKEDLIVDFNLFEVN
jgi:hypothetical protein